MKIAFRLLSVVFYLASNIIQNASPKTVCSLVHQRSPLRNMEAARSFFSHGKRIVSILRNHNHLSPSYANVRRTKGKKFTIPAFALRGERFSQVVVGLRRAGKNQQSVVSFSVRNQRF